MRKRDYFGPGLCALGALCLLTALIVELGSTTAKILMATAALAFVPGAYITLVLARRAAGPPR